MPDTKHPKKKPTANQKPSKTKQMKHELTAAKEKVLGKAYEIKGGVKDKMVSGSTQASKGMVSRAEDQAKQKQHEAAHKKEKHLAKAEKLKGKPQSLTHATKAHSAEVQEKTAQGVAEGYKKGKKALSGDKI